MKSLGLRFSYRCADRTLTDDEVNEVHARIVQKIVQRYRGINQIKDRPIGNQWRRQEMTKIDIIQDVYEKLGFSKKDSARIVESVFDIIKDSLTKGEKIKISGFGNFVVKEKKSRRGRNPQTGDEIAISARRVLTFKSSQVLRKALND